uniref:Uncharacterized protein n=1 Tax=Oryza glumipatula TaxID=40148 RepID=A0A0E0BHQ2_9ORYZ
MLGAAAPPPPARHHQRCHRTRNGHRQSCSHLKQHDASGGSAPMPHPPGQPRQQPRAVLQWPSVSIASTVTQFDWFICFNTSYEAQNLKTLIIPQSHELLPNGSREISLSGKCFP